MNLDNSKLNESNILNSTTGNDALLQFSTVPRLTIQEQRKQQSEAMFSDLHQMQSQQCETNFAKNQHILRNFCNQENNFSKSNITGGPDLSFPLLSPNDLNLTYSPDEHDSTCGEIFVFSVKNIEKIGKFLNLDHVKLKNLFIKVINDEEVNEEFLSELNSKIMVDNNLTQYAPIDLPNSMIKSCKNPIFNQSTQTNDEYVQVRPSGSSQEHFNRNKSRFNMFIEQITYSSDHDYIQVRPPSSEQEKQSTLKNINPILNSSERSNPTPSIRNLDNFDHITQPNCEFVQKKAQIHENNPPMYSSQDGSHISTRLIIIADKLLHKNKLANDVLSRNTNCRSPDLFSDSSSDDIIPVIKCRAAVAWAVKQPLVIETIEVEPPRAHEVRIKIHATGVCHTDASFLDHIGVPSFFPAILGHEGAGIVESVGEEVTKFKPGDHVVPTYVAQCNESRFCKSNKTNLCIKSGILDLLKMCGVMADGTSRFSCKGKSLSHFMGTSTFSEYTVVADIALVKVNETAAFDRVCLLGCAIPTGYGAAMITAKVETGSSCAIWGLGGVGLACAMGCKRAGAKRIIGIDINPDKFEIAKKFGVTEFINPKDHARPIHEILIEMTDGGLDYTFECIGNVLATQAALESTAIGFGVSVLIGAATEIVSKPAHLLVGRTWKGSIFGGCKINIVPVLVEEYLSGKIMIDEFVTHTMERDKINEAFDLMHAGKSIRSVVKF